MSKYMGMTNNLCVLDDIGIFHGDYVILEVNVVNDKDIPISLQTIIVNFKICDIQDEEIIYLEKEGEMTLRDESIAEVVLFSEDTEHLPISKYRYIIELHYETGDKNIGKGYVTIL